MKHALVVGGTGMLAGVTRWLAASGYVTTVVARNEARLRAFEQSHPLIRGMAVNYYESEKLISTIRQSIRDRGAFELAVCWVHTFEPLQVICDAIADAQQTPWDLYRIRGSGDDDREPDTVDLPPWGRYHEVVLGFVIENGRSRWLTHREISDGIIAAIASGQTKAVVGLLEPRERRPGY